MPKIIKIILLQIIFVLNKIFMSFCPPPPKKKMFELLYKFLYILIPGQAGPNKKFTGRAGNFGPVDTSSRQHPDVLVNIEDSKIVLNLVIFVMNVASSMELLSDFQISCAVSELI